MQIRKLIEVKEMSYDFLQSVDNKNFQLESSPALFQLLIEEGEHKQYISSTESILKNHLKRNWIQELFLKPILESYNYPVFNDIILIEKQQNSQNY